MDDEYRKAVDEVFARHRQRMETAFGAQHDKIKEIHRLNWWGGFLVGTGITGAIFTVIFLLLASGGYYG